MTKQNIAAGIIILAVIVAGSIFYIKQRAQNAPILEPVAIVNGEKILRKDLNNFKSRLAKEQGLDVTTLDESTQTQLQSQAIDILITRALLKQGAKKLGITAEENKIDEQMEAIRQQFENDAAFQDALKTQNLTKEELRKQVSDDIIFRAYFEQKVNMESITATDEEIKEAYDQALTANADAPGFPALEDVRSQIEVSIIQQKQQEKTEQFIAVLRAQAEIEILI